MLLVYCYNNFIVYHAHISFSFLYDALLLIRYWCNVSALKYDLNTLLIVDDIAFSLLLLFLYLLSLTGPWCAFLITYLLTGSFVKVYHIWNAYYSTSWSNLQTPVYQNHFILKTIPGFILFKTKKNYLFRNLFQVGINLNAYLRSILNPSTSNNTRPNIQW